MQRPLVSLVLAGAAFFLAQPAAGQSIFRQRGQHANQIEIEVHGTFGLNYYGRGGGGGFGFGGGARVGIPLLDNGPIPSINNSLALSLGADLLYNTYDCGGGGTRNACVYFTLIPEIMAQWNLYLTPILSVFVEAGVAPVISFGSSADPFFFYPGVAIGGRVHFKGGTRLPALTVRLGFPVGLTVGISF